ncbi:YkgJ family cysteine cluster protein [Sphingomonas sp.]|uniref:YkgJ family cysteine cluster protein n=1 Tax=Sphingomonas sp. TaxID=28214 RepID=UPI00286B4873|nr:YkgJ family cysteine cluster protein [Sphingomonas sp.]
MGRIERRRQLKDDQKRIARGLDVRNEDADELAALMRVLHQLVQTSIERRSVSPLMQFVCSNLTAGAKHIASVQIACVRGCSHCCNLWVDASPPEVLFTVKQMDAAQRSRAIKAVEAACSQTAGASFEARAAMLTPCPLLQGNECGVYADRPLVCRTAVSQDAEICRRSLLMFSGEEIPTTPQWTALRNGYRVALDGALFHAGLAYQSREWNESLRIALVDIDAEANWLAGRDVFAGLPMQQDTATFAHPHLRSLYVHAFGSLP